MFNKVETSNNFVFGADAGRTKQSFAVVDYGSNVFRVRVASARWPNGSQSFATLTPHEFAGTPSDAVLRITEKGELHLASSGLSLLKSAPSRGFGVCGSKWMWTFPYSSADRFYGMGEKNIGFELSKKRTQFWNTDVFADFAWDSIENGSTDPMYASFPVLIMKTQGKWLAIVVDNPYTVFMNTGADEGIFQPGAGPFVPELFFGSRDGQPDVWFLLADQPDVLIRRLQTLQGRTPLPPLWALGHQQCRWGYKSFEDLNRIAGEYEQRKIPNDGLWLDIDYMDGFRVFTINQQHFSAPKQQLKSLTDRGYKVVPILDPGLRRDPAYTLYAEAKKKNILCQTSEGEDFIGYVWPGYTVFPDFSLAEGRQFWAQHVGEFTKLGFSGYWIDMNDPSTGSVPLDDMRFSYGHLPHEAWHNQYALGMAVATHDGLLQAKPDERPFIISRSGFLSSARHTALWTGDNMANEHHMKGSIPLSLNLSVSGMPFNGPDVPGFALSASAELMRAWYKLGFLFPFLRNHKIAGQADQEPWTRDDLTTKIVTEYIRLRYKLLPYLYQQFVLQATQGDPMLRPVWYHDTAIDFELKDDLFFVGPAILQAPFVELAQEKRHVALPKHQAGKTWYDVQNKSWCVAGDTVLQHNQAETTPMFLAAPSCIPMQVGVRTDNKNDLNNIDLLIVFRENGEVNWQYQTDDGASNAWQQGAYSTFEMKAHVEAKQVSLELVKTHAGFGALQLRVLVLAPQRYEQVSINQVSMPLKAEFLAFAGAQIEVLASARFTV